MRQNAVSSAPQNEAPIQMLATSATIPSVFEESRTRSSARWRVWSAALGKSCWRSSKDRLLEVARLEHPPGDEEREQREREDRQQQVVGDHPGQAGEVVLVGLPVEVLDARPGAAVEGSARAPLQPRQAADQLARDARCDLQPGLGRPRRPAAAAPWRPRPPCAGVAAGPASAVRSAPCAGRSARFGAACTGPPRGRSPSSPPSSTGMPGIVRGRSGRVSPLMGKVDRGGGRALKQGWRLYVW